MEERYCCNPDETYKVTANGVRFNRYLMEMEVALLYLWHIMRTFLNANRSFGDVNPN